MPRRLFVVAVAVLSAAPVTSAAPVPPDGGKGIVFPYPAKAPVVLCVNGYDRVRDRLAKMLAAALPDDAARLTKVVDEALDHALKGRKLAAVRKDARVFVVLNDLTTLPDDTKAVSVLVPVTTYKEFLEGFLTTDELKTLDRGKDGVDAVKTEAFGEETGVYLVDLKEYVAVTPHRDTADAYAAKYTAGSTDAMGAELAGSFVKADVALYVNMDQINDQFGDQIRAVRGFIDFGLMQAQQQGMLPGLNKRQLEAVKTVLKGMFQGIEDCRAIVATAEFRPEGLAVRLQARFADGSPSSNLLAQESAGPLAGVAKLPGGFGEYHGSRLGKTFADLLREAGQQFATTEDDARGADLIEEHLKALDAAGPGVEAGASAAGGDAITVTAYKEPEKAVKALTKLYKAVAAGGRVNSVVVKTAPRVDDEAEKHRGFTFSAVSLNFDLAATVAGLPDNVKETTLESLKRTTREKATQWIGTDGKVVVRLAAADWATAREMLDAYIEGKPAVGGEAGFKLTRSNLPDDANLLMVGETAAVLAALADGARAMEGNVPGFPRVPTLKAAKGLPAYLGLAVTLKGDTATVTAFVPGTAMKAARTILDGLFKNVE